MGTDEPIAPYKKPLCITVGKKIKYCNDADWHANLQVKLIASKKCNNRGLILEKKYFWPLIIIISCTYWSWWLILWR